MKCPRCQHDGRPVAKFCEECGTPFAPAEEGGPPAVSYGELQRALIEALDQHTASSQILRVISGSPTDVQPTFDAIAASATRLCAAEEGTVFRFDGTLIHVAAHCGVVQNNLLKRVFPRPAGPGSVTARAIQTRSVVHIPDVRMDPDLEQSVLITLGFRTVLSLPILRDGDPIGAITVSRQRVAPFSDAQIALLQTFADQAVIAIENVRLFTELQEKNRALTAAHAQVTEALDQQTATSEILRVIAASPTDLQPVLDALVESASRLCQAADTALLLVEGEQLRVVASHGYADGGAIGLSYPIQRGWVAGRAVVHAQTVHVEDLTNAAADFPLGQEIAVRFGHRTALATPLLREGTPIGTLFLRRKRVRPFSDKEIMLLQTFADQGVIAIENVRLFRELEARNSELAAALDQQTATSDVLRAIAHTQTDAQPVFDTIVRSAVRLCQAANAAVFVSDGRMLYHPANYGSSQEVLAAVRARYPRPLDMKTTEGIAVLTRSVVHVPDTEDPSAMEGTRQSGRLIGFRSVVTVPMLREDDAVGAILVTRRQPGAFSDSEIELLKTFTDQAVIAIENVRMVTELQARNREIEDKSRQLEAASQHKSEFLANMSHELRTPLNAIIGFSEVLGERMFGELNEKQDEYLKDIHASGQHLLSLINDILDLSKIEAGRMELDLGTFDLPNVIDTAVLLIRERAGRRGIVLQVATDEGLGEMHGDERKIKQVLLNLLANAIKFTPEGGRIEIRAKPVNGSVEVSVTDTGVGIAPEDQEAIFEEFRQVGTADKKVEGTGLGLALSRKFIELHGGRIWVESQVGAGSTFTFTIPIRTGT
jgi:two-component system, NtrC family, sensor kinase